MAAASKLAREARAGASELGFANRKLLEREEGEGNASPASEWPESSHARRPTEPPLMAPSKLAGTTLGSTTSVERRPKKERMTRHAHRREGRRRRLGAAASRGGRGVPAVVLSARARMGAEARRGELGRRRRRAALCPLLIRARSRGEDRGGAGRGLAVELREREREGKSGWTVGEGDADRRTRAVSGGEERGRGSRPATG